MKNKKWYKVSFYAKLSEDDVHALNKYFYDTMVEAMDVSAVEGLEIEEDEPVDAEENADIVLEEDDYQLDKNGNLRIDKSVFDDFVEDDYIDIKFLDEEDEPIRSYIMKNEDDNWIFCEYFE